jgi:integrase
LTEITSEHIDGFTAHIRVRGLSGEPLAAASTNARLRVLRRAFSLALEWGVIDKEPKITFEGGEVHRERILTVEEEQRYIAAACPLLADVATVLADSGMRPEESFRMRWENVAWVNGRHGSWLVTHGKTKAARRHLPMTPRVRAILEARWESSGRPETGWVWPADAKSGHIEPSTLRKVHRKAIKDSKVRPFVLYTLRHTFLTRLGASGCDVWTLARIAGHSSLAISARYVHVQDDRVVGAMDILQGHKTGHSLN